MKHKNSAVDMTEGSFLLHGAPVIWNFFTVVASRQHRDTAYSTAVDCHNKIPSFTYTFQNTSFNSV